MAEASLSSIYNRLNSAAQYHPFSADTFNDWSLEAGDVVQMKRGTDTYDSPVYNNRMTWRGKAESQIGSTGRKEREAISQVSAKKYARGGGSGIRNGQELYNEVWDHYGQLHSVISQTASTIYAYVEDTYNQLQSGIEITSSTLTAYVIDRYNQLQSGIEMTSSTITAYVNDHYNQLSSGIALSTSSVRAYVINKYNQMQSFVELTASSFTACVSGVTNSYGKITAASIAAKINENGSGVYIEADHVHITGDTTVSGVFSIEDGSLKVAKNSTFVGNITLITAGSYVQAPNLNVASGGKLQFIGSQSGEHYDITAVSIKGHIKSASVTNNVLTLTPVSGSAITFSKATPLEPGSWSGGGVTIYGKQTNKNTSTNEDETVTVSSLPVILFDSGLKQKLNGTAAASTDKEWYVPVKAKYNANIANTSTTNTYYTGLRVHVDATGTWNNGYDACYGTATVVGNVSGTLNYGATATVTFRIKNKSGSYVDIDSRSYTAPKDKTNNIGLGGFTYQYNGDQVDQGNRHGNRIYISRDTSQGTDNNPLVTSRSHYFYLSINQTGNTVTAYCHRDDYDGEYFLVNSITVSSSGGHSTPRYNSCNNLTYLSGGQQELYTINVSTGKYSSVGSHYWYWRSAYMEPTTYYE